VHENAKTESAHRDLTCDDLTYDELLSRPIRELGLTLAGSPVERFVEQLYRELDAKGLAKFRPACYLTDEWGCPSASRLSGFRFIWRTRRWRNWKKRRMTSKTREKS